VPPASTGRSQAAAKAFSSGKDSPLFTLLLGHSACTCTDDPSPPEVDFVRGVRSAGVSLKIGWYFLYPLYEARQQGKE
jgi:hypothetical protein